MKTAWATHLCDHPTLMSEQSAHDRPAADMPEGVGPDDLPAIRRELFMDVLSVARADHDPCEAWEEFCEAAWSEAALAFGFVEREPWPGVDPPGQPPDTRVARTQRERDDDS